MNKTSYSSGFLYHAASQQILLQQRLADEKSPWSLLGSKSFDAKTSEQNFRRIVHKLLNLKLHPHTIHPVYNYFHDDVGADSYVLYAEVQDLVDFPPTGKVVFSWFTPHEISKLNLSKQTKQDIVVGQRVIDAGVRKKAGERTIE